MRLDDACPSFDRPRWLRFRDLLSRFKVKPIAAVIPENRFPGFAKFGEDPAFYEFILDCRDRYGWELAMHGFTHELTENRGGVESTP